MATDGRPPGLLSPYETIKLSVDRGDLYSSLRLKEFECMGTIEVGGEEQAWDSKCELCAEQEVRCFVPGDNVQTSKCSFCFYRKAPCSLAQGTRISHRTPANPRPSPTPRSTQIWRSIPRSASRRPRTASRSPSSSNNARAKRKRQTQSPTHSSPTNGLSLHEFLVKDSFLGSQAKPLRGRPPTPKSHLTGTLYQTSVEEGADGGAKVAEDERFELSAPVRRLEKVLAAGKSLSPMPNTPIPFRLNRWPAARKTCPSTSTVEQDYEDFRPEESDDSSSDSFIALGGAASGVVVGADGSEVSNVEYRMEIATLKDRVKIVEEENANLKRHVQALEANSLALKARVRDSEAEDQVQRHLVQQLEARLNKRE